MASAACHAMGVPEAHDIRSGLSPGPVAMAASPMAYTSGCETDRIVPSTTIRPAGVRDLQRGGPRDRVDGEAGGPHGDRGRDERAVDNGHLAVLDAGHIDVLVRGDAEPAEDVPQMT